MQSSGSNNPVQPLGGAVKESVGLLGQQPGPGSLGFRRVRRVDFSIENMEFSILGPDIGPDEFLLGPRHRKPGGFAWMCGSSPDAIPH